MRILNFAEAVTGRRLKGTAEIYGAQVYAKVRVADVLPVNGSGISDDLFTFALRAHFDFVVADGEHEALLAVEYDGPHHDSDARAKQNDLKKQALCRRFNFPLARVREEHLFKKARGLDYITWLAEMFFTNRQLVEAQRRGDIPDDEPISALSVITAPHLGNRTFPLMLSGSTRRRIHRLCMAGELTSLTPTRWCGRDGTGLNRCLAMAQATDGQVLMATGAIHLQGFEMENPLEIVAEIAVANLGSVVESYERSKEGGVGVAGARASLKQFLEQVDSVPFGVGNSLDLPFAIEKRMVDGGWEWRLGPFGDQPAFVKVMRGAPFGELGRRA